MPLIRSLSQSPLSIFCSDILLSILRRRLPEVIFFCRRPVALLSGDRNRRTLGYREELILGLRRSDGDDIRTMLRMDPFRVFT